MLPGTIPAIGIVAVTYTGWSTTDKNAGITITTTDETNDTAQSAGALQAVRSDVAIPAGKRYFEFEILDVSNTGLVGIANSTASLSSNGQSTSNDSWGVREDGFAYFDGGGTPDISVTFSTVNDVVGLAFDSGAGDVWFRDTSGYAGDPGAGTGADYAAVTGSSWFAYFATTGADTQIKLITNPANFTYAVPSGFTGGF